RTLLRAARPGGLSRLARTSPAGGGVRPLPRGAARVRQPCRPSRAARPDGSGLPAGSRGENHGAPLRPTRGSLVDEATTRSQYRIAPIPEGAPVPDTSDMVQFAIRCQRTVPLDPDELERSLEQRVRQLRPAAPTGTLRASRITQGLPSGAIDVGWLLEFELPESELPRIDKPLTDALTDMRLLGFQPT